ncbi:MAG TPA: carbon starvation protein A [bacterium]|nr:carbon starvation protein A [bacterium]
MNVLPLILVALLTMAIAYRYYSAFLAAKVVVLDDRRKTPAHLYKDEHNYKPMNKWVLFGHHFAAIAGSGPLIGPVLAAQFGYMPGFLWILIGVCLGGAMHDFMILTASVRRKGRSLADIARHEISPLSGVVGSIAILIIVIVTLAGLGLAVVNALKESSWGTFSIAMTIPAALLVGLWMFRIRPGKIAEASIIGVVLLVAGVIVGGYVPGSPLAPYFTFSRDGILIAMAVYGFFASVLPVWLLLTPRDYLSSYMKIGTIAALVVGLILVHPDLQMPAITAYAGGGGPIIPGKLFPFVFITIACGAISGYHALVSSGTTPKMVDKETDVRMIGYGGMLMEGVVGLVALFASCSLFPADYFAINVPADKFAALGLTPVKLQALCQAVGENVAGRPGGAVSLAVGFAQIFAGIPGLERLMAYLYHFMILFEALFVLSTVDAGTRVARFLLQEFVGRVWKPFEDPKWIPGTVVSTGLVVFAWAWFIGTGTVSTVWPMFGTANQLLASLALAVATSAIINAGRVRYAWTTFIPMVFVSVTTLYAAWLNIFGNFLPLAAAHPEKATQAWVDIVLTVIIMVSALLILAESFRRWYEVLVLHRNPKDLHKPLGKGQELPVYGCC